jgi:prepilin-type N-terminal cleavage/methylation domain-containing protein
MFPTTFVFRLRCLGPRPRLPREAAAHGQQGFTLIELMTVVSIIGLLTAIAVPNFMSYLNRTRQSEARTNLPLIASYQMAYKLRHGSFLACPVNPSGPGMAWSRTDACWTKLGFTLVGDKPIYRYQIEVAGDTFVIRAMGNLDDDDTLDVWEETGGADPRLVVNDIAS